MTVTDPFPARYFTRYDESDDTLFYTQPRLVVHIDDGAIAALQGYLQRTLPPDAEILDLMSSYRSHLPAGLPVRRVVGLGMNAEELRRNPQLSDFIVHDLNTNPELPYPTASFDAALCTVSVQYLVQPIAVFAEVGRVLKPGAPFVVSFSNRCFPSKAVQIWLHTGDNEHRELVKSYFDHTQRFERIEAYNLSPRRWWGDPLHVVTGYRTADVL